MAPRCCGKVTTMSLSHILTQLVHSLNVKPFHTRHWNPNYHVYHLFECAKSPKTENRLPGTGVNREICSLCAASVIMEIDLTRLMSV